MAFKFNQLTNLSQTEQYQLLEDLNRFEADIASILKDVLLDFVYFGSLSDGTYVQGKGDIDFLVLSTEANLNQHFEAISDLHRQYRREDCYAKYLEGCYLSISPKNAITGGLYIGTNETGWKTFEGSIFTVVDHSHMRHTAMARYGRFDLEAMLSYDKSALRTALFEMAQHHLNLIERFNDWDFRLHLIHAGARTYAQLKEDQHLSKVAALDWLSLQEAFKTHDGLLQTLTQYRSKLSIDEKSALDCMGAQVILQLITKLYQAILALPERNPQDEEVCHES